MSSKRSVNFLPLIFEDSTDSLDSNYTVSSMTPSPVLANKASRSIILLDWDDTIMPSTYIMKTFGEHSKSGYAAIKKQTISDFLSACGGKIFSDSTLQSQFAQNMENVGEVTLELLGKLIGHFSSSNLKIVTNGARGWLAQSLAIACSVSESYRKVKALLAKAQIDIVYARNPEINSNFWKSVAYHSVLGRAKIDFTKPHVNIITIGDQWTDHVSLQQLTLFEVFKSNIFHHQIKLYDQADCDYLCVELKYIGNMIETHIVSNACDEGIILEFEG